MKINVDSLKELDLFKAKVILIDILVTYKNAPYPEDLEDDIGKILKEYNLIEYEG